MGVDAEIKSKVISYLRNTSGVSASDIAKDIGYNRITIGKYLQVLEAQKLVVSKKVASAIYWQLAESSTKPKILIVDDEKHIVDLIRLCLGDSYNIFEAYDGEEAIVKAQAVVPNLIILDLMMPKKNGYEVCEFVRKNSVTKDIPIVILSAKGGEEDKVKAIQVGANDYLVKPFDPLELEARVASFIRKNNSSNAKNSITNLPNEIIACEMKQMWNQNHSSWVELKVKINNYDTYADEFGRKKAHEVIMLISRMVSEYLGSISKEKNTSGTVFLGHVEDNIFVIYSKNKLNLQNEIGVKFDKMLPYFYSKGKSKQPLSVSYVEQVHKGVKHA